MTLKDKIKQLEIELDKIYKRCNGYSKLSDKNACLSYNDYNALNKELEKLKELNNDDLN